jgi:hypothetical protein
LSEVWLLNFLRLSSGCIRAVPQVSRHKNLHARNAVAKPSSLYHTFILSKTLGKHWQTQIDMFFRPGNATHWQEGATTSTHICTRAYVKPIWRNIIYIYVCVCVCVFVFVGICTLRVCIPCGVQGVGTLHMVWGSCDER